MDLIDLLIKEGDKRGPTNYRNYFDPDVREYQWTTPVTAGGFVDRRNPNRINTDSKNTGEHGDFAREHEFEHTQQVKSGKKFPFLDGLQIHEIVQEYVPESSKQSHDPSYRGYRETLADLASLYQFLDNEKRLELENKLKNKYKQTSLGSYKDLQDKLYPRRTKFMESEQQFQLPELPSLMSQMQRWIRNKTAY